MAKKQTNVQICVKTAELLDSLKAKSTERSEDGREAKRTYDTITKGNPHVHAWFSQIKDEAETNGEDSAQYLITQTVVAPN